MSSNTSLYKRYYMVRKSKYKTILLKILPDDRLLNTSQIIKLIKRKEKKQVHYYLIYKVLNDLHKDGKVKKQEVLLGDKGKQRIFLWRKME